MRMLTTFLIRALWHGLNDPTCVRSLGVAILPYLNLRYTPASLFRDYSLTHVWQWWLGRCVMIEGSFR